MHEAFSKMAVFINYIELTYVIFLRSASSGATDLSVLHLHINDINVYMYVYVYIHSHVNMYYILQTKRQTFGPRK
jgi:hypothetical protein